MTRISYRADDIEKAAFRIPQDAFSIYYRYAGGLPIARRVRDLMSCSAGIRMAVSYAYPVHTDQLEARLASSNGRRRLGVTLTWLVTPR